MNSTIVETYIFQFKQNGGLVVEGWIDRLIVKSAGLLAMINQLKVAFVTVGANSGFAAISAEMNTGMASMNAAILQTRGSLAAVNAEMAATQAGLVTVSPVVKTAATNVEMLGHKARGTTMALGGLAKMLGIVTGFFAARKLNEYMEGWQKLTNELRVVTNSEKEMLRVRKRLAQATTEAEAPIEGTVKLFQRLSLINSKLHKSETELVKITKGVGQALALSGATAAESRSVLLQLAQGLGTAAVNGDEFRSVMENGVVIIHAVAEELGVLPGEVKRMAAEGRLSSVEFVNAFERALPKVEARFLKMKDTIARSMTFLRNQFMIGIGNFSESEDAGNIALKLAKSFRWLGNNTEYLIALIVNLAVIAIPMLIKQLALLVGIINTHPLMALASGAIYLSTWLYKNKDIISLTSDGVVKLRHATRATFKEISFAIKGGIIKLTELITTINHTTAAYIEAGNAAAALALGTDEIFKNREDYFTELAAGLDMITGWAFTLRDIIGSLGVYFFSVIKMAFTELFNFATENINRLLAKLNIREIALLPENTQTHQEMFDDQWENFGKQIEENANFSFYEDSIIAIFARAREAAEEELNKPIHTPPMTVTAKIIGYWEGILSDWNKAITKANFFLGMKNGFTDWANSVMEIEKQMKDATTNFFKDFSSELTEALTGGEVDWQNFARSAINSILQIMIQALLLRAIIASIGQTGWGAGIASLLGGKQFGGPVSSGQPYVVGESKPELFMPATAGRVARDTPQKSDSPNIRIVNAVEGDAILKSASRSVIDKVVVNAITRNSRSLRGLLA